MSLAILTREKTQALLIVGKCQGAELSLRWLGTARPEGGRYGAGGGVPAGGAGRVARARAPAHDGSVRPGGGAGRHRGKYAAAGLPRAGGARGARGGGGRAGR